MSLFEELIEDRSDDERIIKSFETKDELSSQIFEDNKMREEIRKKLLDISDDFVETLGVKFFIHDVVLTGSLSNYNWSYFSDVDLHILVDFKESKYNSDILKEFFDAKKNVWNEKHDIIIKGYDVELYIQDVNEEHISSGVYSVLNDKWIVKPKKDKPNIDDRQILSKAEGFARKIDKLITQNDNVSTVLEKIEDLRKKLKEFRQAGLDTGGEYSYENLTFKLLRRNGYIEKLLKLKTKLTDKKLSVAQ